MTHTECAYAKLNLTLDILGKREDGYHDLKMVMHSMDLADTVTLTQQDAPELTLSSNVPYLPRDGDNLAAKAVYRFFEEGNDPIPGMALYLDKSIPVCAGMAGGSSDAAAVLRLLRRLYAPQLPTEELERIGARIGSDVPYCVRGGTVLAEGRGEQLTDLPPLPPCYFVVCKPDFPIATPELFALVRVKKLRCHPDTAGMLRALAQGDLDGVAHRVYNVFEEVLPRRCSQVFEIKSALLDLGAMTSSMTGSGPTVFGIFLEEQRAREAAAHLKKEYRQTFFGKNAEKPV